MNVILNAETMLLTEKPKDLLERLCEMTHNMDLKINVSMLKLCEREK